MTHTIKLEYAQMDDLNGSNKLFACDSTLATDPTMVMFDVDQKPSSFNIINSFKAVTFQYAACSHI